MKHLKIALLALLVIAGVSNINAQDENNPWAISFGVNAVDFHPTNYPGEITNGGGEAGWYNEFFNADDHYNIIPSLSRISVSRYLNDGFIFEAAGTLNKITKVGNWNNETNPGDLSYFGLDAKIKYDINQVIGDTKWFDPYASVGGGYTWMDGNNYGTGTLNGGLGANVWLGKQVGLYIESTYKHSFDSDFITPHFQHSAGLRIKFGGNDTDGDGIYDKNDACPSTFGLAEFNGCPDSDSDGIIDSEDACPNTAGLAAFKGCPDTDADGIADKDDACPTVKGTLANKGCPDTDGDGVVDKDDKCVDVAGPAANGGCPWPDTDGDGVLDKDDKCVNEVGPASNDGCPMVVTDVVKAELDKYAKTIYFDTGKTSFKTGVTDILDNIAAIMKKYDASSFHIAGHTDSVGSASTNQNLSEGRASAVMNYLVSKGVDATRLTSAGYGETSPVDTNATRAGRANNRRVEINLK